MARRREISNEKLSETDLAAFRQRLSVMPKNELESFYKAAHNACRFNPLRAPVPVVV
jgi:hypothetical protein